MSQTYAQFKAYVVTTLWRDNDTVFSDNFDYIVRQANDELGTMTADWKKREKHVNIAPETEDFNLTTGVTDFQNVISLTDNSRTVYGQFLSAVPSWIYAKRAMTASFSLLGYYAVDSDDEVDYLRLIGPFSAANPGDLRLSYRKAIPDYAVTDTSWVEDEHLNLYLNTVLKHSAMFLREDDRVQTYASLQMDAYQKADEDDKHNLQFGGSPLSMPPHHPVP